MDQVIQILCNHGNRLLSRFAHFIFTRGEEFMTKYLLNIGQIVKADIMRCDL